MYWIFLIVAGLIYFCWLAIFSLLWILANVIHFVIWLCRPSTWRAT